MSLLVKLVIVQFYCAAPRRSLPAGAAFFYSDEALPLSLRCDEDYGAHLTLKVDIGPGELLLAAEAYAGACVCME